MRILIVEDDEPKSREMKQYLSSLPVFKTALIVNRMSYQTGMEEIMTHPPDLLLLDMSIPNYDISSDDQKGGRPRPFGGRDILREVHRKHLPSKVIIVTQFAVLKDTDREEKTLEELKTTFEKDFPSHFLGTVFYRHAENSWQKPLNSLLEKFLAEFSRGVAT